jgi:hypothetical protein
MMIVGKELPQKKRDRYNYTKSVWERKSGMIISTSNVTDYVSNHYQEQRTISEIAEHIRISAW